MRVRCIRILVLLSLIPLALRATSLLGHVTPATAERSTSTGGVISMTSASASGKQQHRGRYRRRMDGSGATLAAFRTKRLRPGGAGGELVVDEKRLAPTGSNPLHNLR